MSWVARYDDRRQQTRLSVSDLLEYEPELAKLAEMFPRIDPMTYRPNFRPNFDLFFADSPDTDASCDDISLYFRRHQTSPSDSSFARHRHSNASYIFEPMQTHGSNLPLSPDSTNVVKLGERRRMEDARELSICLSKSPMILLKKGTRPFSENLQNQNTRKPIIYIGCRLEFLAPSQRLKVAILRQDLNTGNLAFLQRMKLFAKVSLTQEHPKAKKVSIQKDSARNDKSMYFNNISLIKLDQMKIEIYQKRRGLLKKPVLLGTWILPLDNLFLIDETSAWVKFNILCNSDFFVRDI